MEIRYRKMQDYALVPTFATPQSNGADLYFCGHTRVLGPGEYALFDTGIAIEFPDGVYGLVTPRSGLALKNGIIVLNSPGLIDTDYRNSIGVILHNVSQVSYTVTTYDRIAQLILMGTNGQTLSFREVDELTETIRNLDGFGSSGK